MFVSRYFLYLGNQENIHSTIIEIVMNDPKYRNTTLVYQLTTMKNSTKERGGNIELKAESIICFKSEE
ncbi:hypothetical protein MHIR_DE00540 [Candidatus Doolittlea endobia]|uniref:Uncharacterized protein n=1 Tax=Candidatus Doolittlea endobia TaxID=1778262 RepID=A0A143WSX4_9ENTR|nr:hypothetical protein MHIR_DE00540 [Candidatus Doolittlea endobia]